MSTGSVSRKRRASQDGHRRASQAVRIHLSRTLAEKISLLLKDFVFAKRVSFGDRKRRQRSMIGQLG
jgi:hypothetical protein